MRPEYIAQMCDNIYNVWVETGMAVHLETLVAYYQQGGAVPIGSLEQYGLASDIEIPAEYLSFILFCDETGINTCQKDDGHEGGKNL